MSQISSRNSRHRSSFKDGKVRGPMSNYIEGTNSPGNSTSRVEK